MLNLSSYSPEPVGDSSTGPKWNGSGQLRPVQTAPGDGGPPVSPLRDLDEQRAAAFCFPRIHPRCSYCPAARRTVEPQTIDLGLRSGRQS